MSLPIVIPDARPPYTKEEEAEYRRLVTKFRKIVDCHECGQTFYAEKEGERFCTRCYVENKV